MVTSSKALVSANSSESRAGEINQMQRTVRLNL